MHNKRFFHGFFSGSKRGYPRGEVCSRRLPEILLIFLTALSVCLCSACAIGKKDSYGSGATSSKVARVARVHLPLGGGLTIRPPQKMADVSTLWKPLSSQEKRRLGSGQSGLPLAAVRSVNVAPAWLPETEREVMMNYLYRLTVTHKEVTARALRRAADHLPMIREVLAAQGLPPELACLPMVESAFETQAVSHAGAAGLWQLMPATAKRFGLQVDAGPRGKDERFDARKSTEAAAKYLSWLYGYFGDWPLAVAAYNCGEGTIVRLLRQCEVNTLAELTALCRSSAPPTRALAEETLRFVPQLVAAVTVMTNTETLGLPSTNITSQAGLPLCPPSRQVFSENSGLRQSFVGIAGEDGIQSLSPMKRRRTASAPGQDNAIRR